MELGDLEILRRVFDAVVCIFVKRVGVRPNVFCGETGVEKVDQVKFFFRREFVASLFDNVQLDRSHSESPLFLIISLKITSKTKRGNQPQKVTVFNSSFDL